MGDKIAASTEATSKREGYICWDDYFMAVAFLSAQRSKDPNSQVGACIVNEDKKIVGIGYNGMPNGCSDDILPWARQAESRLDTKYPYVCHAELNAILNKNSANVKNCTIYVALFPCNECAKLIIQSGIRTVIFCSDKYHDTDEFIASRRLLDMAGVTCNTLYTSMTFANIHPRNAQLDILTPQVKSRMRQIIAINDVPALRKIITSTNINNSPDALQHAIAIGRIDCVEAMVELGFSLQCTDGAGRSLLHCACPTQPNCVKYLLHKQLSIDHHDNRGLTALHWACQCRSHDCRLLLLHHDSHYHHGHSPTLSRSVWHLPGVPHWPQHLNNLRKPDLHQPDRNAHRTDCLALLVNKGADISRRDLRGRTALHYAVWCNKVNAARLIVDAGLPVDVFDNFGETPLHMACHIGNLDAVCFLLARGASINTRNHFMEAPLHAAVAG
eukprot:Ihof_evm14s4 gene=Ihof_evmTU14s4